MRAAQNYVVEEENGGEEQDEDGDNDNGGDSGNDSESTLADNNANTINTANPAGATGKTAGTAGSASTPATGADAAEAVSYTVVSGDTLWKIAEKFYGSGEYWQKIYNDNADVISNPDRIYEGQVLKLYPLQGDAVTAAISGEGNTAAEGGIQGNYYTVQPGDTLWKIALKVYGKGWRWRKIYQANKSTISDPGQLYVGQVLVIPD